MKLRKILTLVTALLANSILFAGSNSIKPEFVDTLIGPYLDIQKSLAGDDFASAKKAAKDYQHELEHGPKGQLKDHLTTINKIIDAKNIQSARIDFQALSNGLKSLVVEVGTSGKHNLFDAYCPMAFNNKGGAWLQRGQKVFNPYYGAMMLHCGVIREQLVKGSEEGHDHDHSHEGHSH
jgi:Cu(I)/Ag(I) efflux system membrane fusion protein